MLQALAAIGNDHAPPSMTDISTASPKLQTHAPLDVHMGYSQLDLVHAGGWVGMIKLAPLLAARGINWTIWCCSTNPEVVPPCDGFRIGHAPPSTSPQLQNSDHAAIEAAIQAAIESRTQGRGCVVIAGSYGLRSMPMMLRAMLRGVRFIRDGQIMPDPLPKDWWPRIKQRINELLLTFPTAAHFALSQELGRAYASRYRAPDSRIFVVRNGADTRRFSPVSPDEKSALREKLGLPLNRPLVLFCGGLIRRKGVDVLLKAWAQVQRAHPSAVLVMRGSIGARATFVTAAHINEQASFTEQLYVLKEALPRPDDVIFAGHGPDVESYYRCADLFVFPSRLEGLPFAVIEAMSCGLPCIVAPFTGIPRDGEELGRDGEHHVRTTHVPEEMAGQVIEMLENPARAHMMGSAARLWIEETQDFDKVADIWAAAYRSVAGDPS